MDLGQFLAEESERLQAYGKDDEVLRLRQEARHHFEHALQICPDLEKAHEGLSYVLAHLGEGVDEAFVVAAELGSNRADLFGDSPADE